MDTTQYHDEELRQLFRQLPVEKSAEWFSARVMKQIVFVARRKRMLRIAWGGAILCLIMLLSVVGFYTRAYWGIYLWEYFEPLSISVSNNISSITGLFADFGNRVVLPGLLFLALLLGDLFIRRHLERKNQWTDISTTSYHC